MPAIGQPLPFGPACCVIDGMGSIGKTQTALEYCYLYASEYDGIFWLRSETDVELSASYAAIAVELRLRSSHTPSGNSQGSAASGDGVNVNIETARDWLETADKKWLLVFDNVQDINSVQRYIPRCTKGRGAMIITTQKLNIQGFTEIFQRVGLESLSSDDSITLLFKYLERESRGPEETTKAFEIIGIVGGLRLAIATIGGCILMSNSTIDEFLNHIQPSDKIWDRTESTHVKGYDKGTLGSVFELALSELPANSRKLINILGFLNPDSVPEAMFLGTHDDPSLEFLGNAEELATMIQDLNLRQLVKRESTGQLSLHRSLQLSILNLLSNNYMLRLQVFNQALSLIRKQLPPPSATQGFRADLFAKYKTYVPQIVSLYMHSLWLQPPITHSLDFAKVMIDVGTYMWRTGQFKECEKMLTTAEDILEKEGLP
ncbi:P-loop containing nucleoside triphosphate hydrolase protein [Bombardia bombarda]|uniref:P-loop containing nucleoside triphosphate hydrolase protein n=1 Tax=Bombardia bombarda TaxID=252184 RepID=A0AA39WH03_9PEZI|nr:P-loop containing nucleoside triphosphate hydrolase protein [Bombardia bombarda]